MQKRKLGNSNLEVEKPWGFLLIHLAIEWIKTFSVLYVPLRSSCCGSFFCALPKLLGCKTEPSFARSDANGNGLWLGRKTHELDTVSETVAERFRSDSDANTGFDG